MHGPRQETHTSGSIRGGRDNIASCPACLWISQSPEGKRTGPAWEHLFVSPYPSPSLLRLIPPPTLQLRTPSPKYQLTGYPGNSAGRLPVTLATQHGHQAALHRKVRGPTRLLSSWDVAGRIGPGWEAYMPEGIKFLLSGTSISHEAASSREEHEP